MDECQVAGQPTTYDLDKTGIWGEVVRQRRPIVVNDFAADNPLKKGYPDGHVRLQRFLSVPVERNGRIVAVAGVANKPGDYGETDVLELTLLMDAVWKTVETTRNEEALRQSQERLRSIFRIAPTGIGLVCNRVLTEVNSRICEMTGYRADELIGHSARILYPTQEAFDFVGTEKYRQIREKGTGVVETVWRRKDGRLIDVLLASTPLDPSDLTRGVTFTALDITDRKQAVEELRENQQRLLFLLKNSSDSVVILDADGSQRYVSPSAERITGFPVAELQGKSLPQIIHPDDLATVAKAWDECLAHPERTVTVQYRHVHKTRGWVVSEAIAQSFLAEPSVNGVVAAVRDVTERTRAEEERRRLQDQLNQVQKMESIGRLAGGVAHDFNNMLGVILGQVELELARLAPENPLHAALSEIQKAGQRSADLTRQLLAFARRQTATPRILDLNQTVAGMLKMLERLIGEGIQLHWSPGQIPGLVRIDPSQVDQILANLCVNARDAIGELGRVTIETDIVLVDQAFCASHADAVPGRYVVLSVSDTGCGMTPQVRSRLFEPFFTTKEQGKGTGLGLATVWGIVRQNQGFIDVETEPGEGATFRMYLPEQAQTPTPAPQEPPTTPASSGTGVVLLVEDEPMILKLAALMLERLGYTVIVAPTPEEAIRLAREATGPIDLLMTDVVMPGMNGRDLARTLQSLCPTIKCLFMSGYTADVIAHHGVLDAGVHFIQKPFSVNELATRVREALAE